MLKIIDNIFEANRYNRYNIYILISLSARTKMKYGLFEYSTENIGDEVQSIAARRFLPSIDYYFDRDNIDKTDTGKDEVKLIMNGWYTHKPENFPPKNKHIHPLLISMYIEQHANNGKTAKRFAGKECKKFLTDNGPVGARDKATLDFLKKNKIDSYFSGCVTLTLCKDSTVKKSDYILAVDVSDKVYEKMKRMTSRQIVRIDTNRCIEMPRNSKFALAEYYLSLYQSAHAVVTRRLHCMLPCLALETPVLAITGREPHRYAGLVDLVRNASEDDFLKESFNKFSLDEPPKNPTAYKKIRESVAQKCSDYTGYDSKNSYLSYGSVDNLLNSADFKGALSSLVSASFKMEHYKWHFNGLSKYEKILEKQIKDLDNELRSTIDQLEAERKAYQNMGIRDSLRCLRKAIKARYRK